jgi:hypothetical protein
MWIVEPGHTEAEFKARHMSSDQSSVPSSGDAYGSREESHGTR